MAHNEETFGMNGQKDLATPPIKAFDTEKLLAMQKQVVEGMTQNGNSQQCISGPVKRQVAEAWKNKRTHGGVVVIHRDIRINAIVVGIMVFLVFGIGQLKRKLR